MKPERLDKRPLSTSGFTFVELSIYVVVASLILGVVVQFMINQSQAYTQEIQIMDARETVRSAAALLTWEFRGLSAAAGDLYTIKSDTVALRSSMATGIVCAKADSLPHYGIDGRTGQIFTTANDSAMVYLPGLEDWVELDLTDQFDPILSSVPFCEWGNGNSFRPDLVVEMAGDTAGIQVGTPWTAFRRVEFGIYQDGGRWWLGRKVGSAASYEKLTGPLVSQADGGLVLTYLDDTGNTTTDPTKVSQVQIEIRSESSGFDRGKARRDSIQFTVWLRG